MSKKNKPIPSFVKRNRDFVLRLAQDSEARGNLQQALETYLVLRRLDPSNKMIRDKIDELNSKGIKLDAPPVALPPTVKGPKTRRKKDVIPSETRSFLIQTHGEIADCHGCWNHTDRTFAEELYVHGYYLYEYWDCAKWGLGFKWRKRTDLEFGKVRAGDQIIQYCTSNVRPYPCQIKFLYRVTDLEHIPRDIIEEAIRSGRVHEIEAKWIAKKPRLIRLEKVHSLIKPVNLNEIMSLVGKTILSKNMGNCSSQGFNICEVEYSDYEFLLGR